MSVDADGPFLTDRVCSNTTLCKLGVPSKEFSIPKGFGDFKGGKIRQKVESKSMAKNEHLRSVFDWIQIQFDKTEFSPREIIEDILFLDYDLFIENKGALNTITMIASFIMGISVSTMERKSRPTCLSCQDRHSSSLEIWY